MTAQYNDAADTSALARYGVSDELVGMFDSLRETPGMAGNKFRLDDVNGVAQSVVCRNYGKACLELSYLLYSVMQLTPTSRHSPLLDFFWLNEAITPRRFRLAFAGLTPGDENTVYIGKDFLHISLDNSEFAISPTRVGFLAVLFELLVNVSPQLLQDAEVQLEHGRLAQLKAFSSQLQKSLYAYLNDHLVPAQQQRRFRFLSQWLKAQDPTQRLKEQINDELILQFWQHQALEQDDGLGFRRYRTVVENFISLLQALAIGDNKQQIAHAATIGYDTEQGEIHPELLDHLLTSEDEISDIGWLSGSVKFITKQQLQLLEPLILAGGAVSRLPLSVARTRLFGDWQAELVQAVRNGDNTVVKAKVAKGTAFLYEHYLSDLSVLSQGLANVRLAIVFILTEHQQTSALQPMAELLSAQQWALIKQRLLDIRQELLAIGQNEGLAGPQLIEQISALFFARLAQYRLQHPPVNELLQQAKAAFKANNRMGFKQLPEVEALNEYELGFDSLGGCRGQLALLNKHIKQLFLADQDLTQKSAADFAIFQSTFEKMYSKNQ
ncbi:MAG: hypothetical protein ACI9FJ_000589 [Alteromonadaceae bacterium]|jgi:hypothetical protein